jgi:glycosyltransferase involved in cell wall biosynthesis
MIFVWLNKRAWRHPGPIVNMAVHNAQSLAALGYETHLCVSAGETETDTDADLENFYGVAPNPSLHVHRMSRWQLGSSRLSVAVFLKTIRLAKTLARRDQVAIITREASFLPWLAWLCGDARIKGFYEAHDFYADLSWRADKVRFGDLRQGWMERTFLPQITGLICITQAQRELYRHVLLNVESCALPLGTKPFSEQDPEHRRRLRTLVYVGHLHASKGVKMLLGAVPELAQKNIRVAFWGGSETQIAQMTKRLKKRGVADHVQFVGFRPPDELQNALSREVSVGVVALRDTFYNRYLTCPVKALDYLSHGLPIIGSDLPSVREVVGNAGRFIAPDDSSALVRAAVELLDDPQKCRAAAQASRARGLELLWEKRAARIVRFVTECD